VGQGRLELPTSRLSGVRSNHLSYWPSQATAFAVARTNWPCGRWLLPGCSGPDCTGPRSLETESYASLMVGLDLVVSANGERDAQCCRRLLRKEVIQPQVPLRLPCYDFTPVTVHSLGPCLSCELAQALLEQATPMV
jgi:hypothetical protein